jgi:hypothetical protein
VPILPSHHGRGQHGCGDQPSRQNFESRHFSFSIGYRSQNILASALKMSGATGGLNEIFVYGRSPLREVREFFNGLRNAAGCRHQRHRPIRRAPVDRRVKTHEAPNMFSSLIGRLVQMNDLKRPLMALHAGVGGSVGPIDRSRLCQTA